MIPVLLGAAALWGASEISDAKDNVRRAGEINSQAAAIANDANAEVNRIHSNMNDSLDNLGKTETRLMSGNIKNFVNMMNQIVEFEYKNNPSGIQKLEQMGFKKKVLEEIKIMSQKAVELSSSSNFQNADGGSYAAVGLLGAGVMTTFSVVAAPAMLLYGLMKSDEAKAALYEAKTRLDEARLYQERCKNMCALFSAISARSRQINNLINDLNRYYEPAVNNMRQIVNGYHGYDFDSYSEQEEVSVFYAYQITQTIKIIIETPLVQSDWSINPMLDSKIEIGERNVAMLRSAN